MTTALQLLDQARIRHPAFLDVRMPDGALVLFLNTRQRALLLLLAAESEALVSQSAQIAATVNGILLGVDGAGVPQFLSAGEDGYPVFLDVDGNPYLDFTLPPVVFDPFGENGGTPGFPLPDQFVKLVSLAVIYDDGQTGPLDLVLERDRFSGRGRVPRAFVSGNRLVPVREGGRSGANLVADQWTRVSGVQLSYVAMSTVATLADELTLPTVLEEALIAGLAEMMAIAAQPKTIDAASRRSFTTQRQEAELTLKEYGERILGDVTTQTVSYRG